VADIPPALAAALQDRYLLERELGHGGMATVFLAHDLKHDRPVALKVLRPELAATLGPERFQREIRIAARLQHPRIVSVHDSGEAAGQLWFTMPYLRGENLRERLRREGQLPLNLALRIAREVASALDYAHHQGVIHRDVKPENILLTPEGDTLVGDFGIARALGSAGTERMTQTGLALGTPAYMSPEQASAERELDSRTDIYALGCVLYEMLSGGPPFAGPTAQAIIAQRFTQEPAPLRSKRRDVPATVEAAVARALACDPAARFATAAEFADALLAAEPATVPVRQTTPAAANLNAIAVLPFADMSPGHDQEYFADGIAEEIINALTKLGGLRVASRRSSFAFKGRNEDAGDIGRKLKVGSLLEGSVRKAGNRLRVTAQLVNTAEGYQLWSERYDRDLEDVFAIQDEIAANIVRALPIFLTTPAPRARDKPPTRSLEAYDYFLRGRQFFDQYRRKGFEAALEMFERAVAIDPQYARAYAAIADCWSFLNHVEANEAYVRQAEAASRNAVELDPDLAEAHASLGLALSSGGRYEAAHREFELAIGLDPNLFEAYYFDGRASLAAGDLSRAAAMFERAIELRPEDYQAPTFAVMVYVSLGQPTQADAAARRAVDKVEQHLQLHPYDARALYMGAGHLGRLGDTERAEAWAKRALAAEPDDPGVLYNVCCAYANMGKTDVALDCLEQAAKVGLPGPEWLAHDSDLDPLRGHPRFQAVLASLPSRTAQA